MTSNSSEEPLNEVVNQSSDSASSTDTLENIHDISGKENQGAQEEAVLEDKLPHKVEDQEDSVIEPVTTDQIPPKSEGSVHSEKEKGEECESDSKDEHEGNSVENKREEIIMEDLPTENVDVSGPGLDTEKALEGSENSSHPAEHSDEPYSAPGDEEESFRFKDNAESGNPVEVSQSPVAEQFITTAQESLKSEEDRLSQQITDFDAATVVSPSATKREGAVSSTPPVLPPRDHSSVKPELPPRNDEVDDISRDTKKQIHAVPPPLSEEMKSETFRKNVALSQAADAPPPPPPRSRHERSESADYDLIISRFQENTQDYLSKDETAKENLEEGARILKSSYTTFLEGLGEGKPKHGEQQEWKEESKIDDESVEQVQEEEEEVTELTKVDWPFWTRVVNDYPNVAKNESEKLEEEISAGIPPQVRGIIWQLISNSKSKEIEEMYKLLLEQESPHERAIKRDLLRTKFIPSDKVDSLFNVIKSYSLCDPEVGYTQGMAFITTPLLLNVQEESEAFGLLLKLMKNYNLRDLFLPDMPGLHLKLYQFDRMLEESSPRLYNHLLRQGIRSSMYATQWFLTFFAYKFPLGFVLRIFDIVFTEGIESILKFAVVLMLKNEEALVKLQFDSLLDYLKDELFVYYLKETVKKREELVPTNTSNSSFSFLHKVSSNSNQKPQTVDIKDEDYDIDLFVRDAMTEVKIMPISLKRYTAEYEEIHQLEFQKEAQYESMRIKNKQLHREVRKLEHDFTLLNREHITIANELIENRLSIETLQDENNDLKLEIQDLKSQLAEEIRKQSLPNPDAELPTDLRADLEKTMARNLEVMNENQELQDKISALEKEIEILKGNKSSGQRSPPSNHSKASPLGNWGGLKKVWK